MGRMEIFRHENVCKRRLYKRFDTLEKNTIITLWIFAVFFCCLWMHALQIQSGWLHTSVSSHTWLHSIQLIEKQEEFFPLLQWLKWHKSHLIYHKTTDNGSSSSCATRIAVQHKTIVKLLFDREVCWSWAITYAWYAAVTSIVQTNLNKHQLRQCSEACERKREAAENWRFSFYLVEWFFCRFFQVVCLFEYTNQMHTMYFGLLTYAINYVRAVRFNWEFFVVINFTSVKSIWGGICTHTKCIYRKKARRKLSWNLFY